MVLEKWCGDPDEIIEKEDNDGDWVKYNDIKHLLEPKDSKQIDLDTIAHIILDYTANRIDLYAAAEKINELYPTPKETEPKEQEQQSCNNCNNYKDNQCHDFGILKGDGCNWTQKEQEQTEKDCNNCGNWETRDFTCDDCVNGSNWILKKQSEQPQEIENISKINKDNLVLFVREACKEINNIIKSIGDNKQ